MTNQQESNIIKIEAEFDLTALQNTIDEALDLNDNEKLFDQLISVEKAKQQVKDLLDQFTSIEAEAKGLIKNKAEALYGPKWESIKGKGYKITKSPTGSVFSISGKVQKKFLVVKESVDSKIVEAYIKEKGKLPTGLDYNPDRGASIRITVKDENA